MSVSERDLTEEMTASAHMLLFACHLYRLCRIHQSRIGHRRMHARSEGILLKPAAATAAFY